MKTKLIVIKHSLNNRQYKQLFLQSDVVEQFYN